MTAPAADTSTLSAECALGQQRGYGGVHDMCRQTEDIPLPHGHGLLLQPRCGCICHRYRKTDT
ncbi:hypothetical protein [Streptomyces sp. NPDC005538]|uniref:hypothetical protein n=1 Tax=Streptomyces sp. NPDC005538 TaxID=3157043 RepID=UPI0033B37C1B